MKLHFHLGPKAYLLPLGGRNPRGGVLGAILTLLLAAPLPAAHAGEAKPLQFGVINQRSVVLTAESWNPILRYVSEKTGVPLALKIGKTAPETTAMTVRGEHAFAYTNHLFTPERDRLGYKVILRMAGEPIHGVIVVREDSPIRGLEQLQGKTVAFPSREAFIGYQVPMDHLKRSGIEARPVFPGNQEGAMSQLQYGQVAAAGVNRKILEKYAQREDVRYRVIWTSEPYLDIPVLAHPALPEGVVAKVRDALAGMNRDPEGIKALQASAAALESKQLWSFVPASDRDYDNYRRFYRSTVLGQEQ
jgi:phosphonate transport system substrate-binding protein